MADWHGASIPMAMFSIESLDGSLKVPWTNPDIATLSLCGSINNFGANNPQLIQKSLFMKVGTWDRAFRGFHHYIGFLHKSQ
jgi:hypothetical protein